MARPYPDESGLDENPSTQPPGAVVEVPRSFTRKNASRAALLNRSTKPLALGVRTLARRWPMRFSPKQGRRDGSRCRRARGPSPPPPDRWRAMPRSPGLAPATGPGWRETGGDIARFPGRFQHARPRAPASCRYHALAAAPRSMTVPRHLLPENGARRKPRGQMKRGSWRLA